MKRCGFMVLCALVVLCVLLAGCEGKTAERSEAGEVFAFCGGEAETAQTEYTHETFIGLMSPITKGENKGAVRLDLFFKKGEAHFIPMQTIFDALCEMKIGERTDMRATDSEQSLTFVKTDGTTCMIRFEQRNLLYEEDAYQLENDAALWKALREVK